MPLCLASIPQPGRLPFLSLSSAPTLFHTTWPPPGTLLWVLRAPLGSNTCSRLWRALPDWMGRPPGTPALGRAQGSAGAALRTLWLACPLTGSWLWAGAAAVVSDTLVWGMQWVLCASRMSEWHRGPYTAGPTNS